MPITNERMYRAHVANLQAVETGLLATFDSVKSAVSFNNFSAEDAHLRVYLLLLGTWAECRLRKLLYEPNGFTEQERAEIVKGENASQIDRWSRALEIGFSRRYLANSLRMPSQAKLPATAWLQLTELKQLIEKDLTPIIEMRNKLAHGQWVRTFNSDHTEFTQHHLNALNNENALSAKFKFRLIRILTDLIHDLVAGNHAYQRDFDLHYEHLKEAKRNLQNRSYSDWKAQRIKRQERGQTSMRNNIIAQHQQ